MEEQEDRRVRLGKLLAQRGVASRRAAEQLVADGAVTVDDEVITEPGTLVDPKTSKIKVSGRRLPPEPEKLYYVLYKPRGMLVGRAREVGKRDVDEDDEELVDERPSKKERESVAALLEQLGLRLETVGRLDYNTEGALLLTNDGELLHRLTHPSTQVPKRYVAKVYRTPSDSDLKAIERGVTFPDGKSRPAKVRVLEKTGTENAWLEITVTEGGPRVVQRIFTQLGHPVSKLRRESFATISIRGMERGQVRPLTGEEVTRLQDLAAGKKPQRAGKGWRKPGFAKPKPKPRRPGPRKPRGKATRSGPSRG